MIQILSILIKRTHHYDLMPGIRLMLLDSINISCLSWCYIQLFRVVRARSPKKSVIVPTLGIEKDNMVSDTTECKCVDDPVEDATYSVCEE